MESSSSTDIQSKVSKPRGDPNFRMTDNTTNDPDTIMTNGSHVALVRKADVKTGGVRLKAVTSTDSRLDSAGVRACIEFATF